MNEKMKELTRPPQAVIYTMNGSYHLGDWVEVRLGSGIIQGRIWRITDLYFEIFAEGSIVSISYHSVVNMKLLSDNERKSLEGK